MGRPKGGSSSPMRGRSTAIAAVQLWAQAVEKAGTVEPKSVAAALHANQFDTVIGTIGFDEKGDVTGYEAFRVVRLAGGNYAPVDPAKLPTEANCRSNVEKGGGESDEGYLCLPRSPRHRVCLRRSPSS